RRLHRRFRSRRGRQAHPPHPARRHRGRRPQRLRSRHAGRHPQSAGRSRDPRHQHDRFPRGVDRDRPFLADQYLEPDLVADPGLLGINTGASLAVVIGIAHFSLTSASSMIWVAILGAGTTAVLVYILGSLGRGGATPLKLALAGVATGAALTSFINAVVLSRADIGDSVRSWQVGGVGGGSYASLQQVAPFLLIGFAICVLHARGLNSLALGDD